ncbi:uncharacterized protein LOC142975133 [Anticarsia gemmatalis]|uniref:uncharacterized protein LOC142975133 n=1 Tax=Anticarsia gemmatalis TaxID=129554 RepID=UPI003F75F0DE
MIKIQMCTTEECLADTLECYMDELVDSYDDFVKKSLWLISLALGSLVIMAIYMMKVLTNRSGDGSRGRTGAVARGIMATSSSASRESVSTKEMMSNKKKKKVKRAYSVNSCTSLTCTSAQCGRGPSRSSVEEKIIREIGFSTCSQTSIAKRECEKCNRSAHRIAIPSAYIPPNLQRRASNSHHCNRLLGSPTSCCSLCCNEDKKR